VNWQDPPLSSNNNNLIFSQTTTSAYAIIIEYAGNDGVTTGPVAPSIAYVVSSAGLSGINLLTEGGYYPLTDTNSKYLEYDGTGGSTQHTTIYVGFVLCEPGTQLLQLQVTFLGTPVPGAWSTIVCSLDTAVTSKLAIVSPKTRVGKQLARQDAELRELRALVMNMTKQTSMEDHAKFGFNKPVKLGSSSSSSTFSSTAATLVAPAPSRIPTDDEVKDDSESDGDLSSSVHIPKNVLAKYIRKP
jgi:hypothetical protein